MRKKGRPIGSKADPRKAIVTCPNCHKEMEMTPHQAKRKVYCSRVCHYQSRWVSRKDIQKHVPVRIIEPQVEMKKPMFIRKKKTPKPEIAYDWDKEPSAWVKQQYHVLINTIIKCRLENKIGSEEHIKACYRLNKLDVIDRDERRLKNS